MGLDSADSTEVRRVHGSKGVRSPEMSGRVPSSWRVWDDVVGLKAPSDRCGSGDFRAVVFLGGEREGISPKPGSIKTLHCGTEGCGLTVTEALPGLQENSEGICRKKLWDLPLDRHIGI